MITREDSSTAKSCSGSETNKNTELSSTKSNTTSVKSQHKVEGKNKKSLHQKQQENLSQQQQQKQTSSQKTSKSDQMSTTSRRAHTKNSSGGANKSSSSSGLDNKNHASSSDCDNGSEHAACITLEDFAKRAKEIKSDINKALINQMGHKIIDQPTEVVKLKEDIYKLSNLQQEENSSSELSLTTSTSSLTNCQHNKDLDKSNNNKSSEEDETKSNNLSNSNYLKTETNRNFEKNQQDLIVQSDATNHPTITSSSQEKIQQGNESSDEQKDKIVTSTGEQTLNNLNLETTSKTIGKEESAINESSSNKMSNSSKKASSAENNASNDIVSEQVKVHQNIGSVKTADDGFEPLLNAKLDTNSKVVALVSSLQKIFNSDAPNHLLELVCRKLVNISEQNAQLTSATEKYHLENQKLLLIKQKLENLCRELQKSNNAIRIESLDLIKVEQGKAKEQTTKIQSTLSGVIKLFDENQQRNMSLRQENQDLQTKLKSLLDHCDNWEKSVEVTLRQKDIENRLIKTELAKANLLKNEEKEKFLGEKKELLQILSMMQEQQHRIEGQEAKLRSDLSSYASKYDECQAVISKGMNRFQTESKKMLKQIEKSKQDYKVLLSKYESSNKRMAQLLEEKQSWDKAMIVANKKIITLEKLCRALKEQKLDSKNELTNKQQQKLSSNNNNNNTKTKSNDKNKKPKDINVITRQTKELAISSGGDVIETNEVVEERSKDLDNKGEGEEENAESGDSVFVLDNNAINNEEVVLAGE